MVNINSPIHSMLINIPSEDIETLFSFEEFKFNFFSFLQLLRCSRAVSEISQLCRSRVLTSGCKIWNKYMILKIKFFYKYKRLFHIQCFGGHNRQLEYGKYSKEYRACLCEDRYIKQEKKPTSLFPIGGTPSSAANVFIGTKSTAENTGVGTKSH